MQVSYFYALCDCAVARRRSGRRQAGESCSCGACWYLELGRQWRRRRVALSYHRPAWDEHSYFRSNAGSVSSTISSSHASAAFVPTPRSSCVAARWSWTARGCRLCPAEFASVGNCRHSTCRFDVTAATSNCQSGHILLSVSDAAAAAVNTTGVHTTCNCRPPSEMPWLRWWVQLLCLLVPCLLCYCGVNSLFKCLFWGWWVLIACSGNSNYLY